MTGNTLTRPARLPAPGPDAAAHSARVAAHIRAAIAQAGGAITFARFMELALYAPGLGYYSAGTRKFGADGDFVTAPEVSPLFARCIARQCEAVLQASGGVILEAGAGTGALACGLLRELAELGRPPEAYLILELSAELRARQQTLLAEQVPELLPRVHWLDGWPDAGLRGVVIANELLDALPVHRFHVSAEGACECYVASDGDAFAWRLGPLSSPLLRERVATLQADAALELAPGYESEINLAAEAWIGSLAPLLQQGAVLLIDYGYPCHEYYHPQRRSGTLMCHYRHHSHSDPLCLVGLQDITAHVDFSAVARAAADAGLRLAGFTTQAHFLLGLGIETMVAEAAGDAARQFELAQQIKRLVLPSGMGELFKVMALTRGIDTPLQGFRLQDHRGRL